MRILRIIFVSLIAVGVCGVVYVLLAAGMAAYMRYKTGGGAQQASANDAAAPAAAPGSASATTEPASPAISLAPPPGVETAASLLKRKWTAPQPGITVPPPFANAPHAGPAMLVAAGPKSTLPPLPLTAVRGRFMKPDRQANLRFVGANDLVIPVMELAMADGKAGRVVLPAGPAANVPSINPGNVRVSTIARERESDRPSIQADPGAAMAEHLLMVRLAPMRTTGLPFVKLAIPDPTPNNAGALRTTVPDADPPMASPDRPMIKFTTK